MPVAVKSAVNKISTPANEVSPSISPPSPVAKAEDGTNIASSPTNLQINNRFLTFTRPFAPPVQTRHGVTSRLGLDLTQNKAVTTFRCQDRLCHSKD
ncbi:MAG TPA: hypothetical protein EYQ81_14640 [Sneathiellales bacterium]|nr:hypothetical protein [Sneathiellales bacterium]